MSNTATWLTEPPVWDKICLTILKKDKPPKKQSNLEDVLKNSEIFPVKFPIDQVRCKNLISHTDGKILNRNINSAYPVIHEHIVHLCVKFLLLKRSKGTRVEQKLYKKMSLLDFVNRLLTKRAVVFVGALDKYQLLEGLVDMNNWETVGTSDESDPLCLQNCLSYDEMKLSAFLSVSSYSYFINDGSRNGYGIPAEDRSNLQEEGVVVGLIGPRFHKPHVMEYQDIIIPKPQNLQPIEEDEQNIRKLFMEFYKENQFLYKEVEKLNDNQRFVTVHYGFFDNVTYSKRLAVSFDTLLIEANHRAKEGQKKSYVYVVGIGLGVWRISGHQEEVFVNTFAERLKVLGASLDCISDVEFAFFPQTNSVAGVKNGELLLIDGHPLRGIRIHISERCPYTKLQDSDKLLVTSYAWDSNALPGNEFWQGGLCCSSDSTAAASCQVSELHNAHINPVVCAENLMVATNQGLVSIQEYIKIVQKRGVS